MPNSINSLPTMTETTMDRKALQTAYVAEIIEGMDLKDCLAILHDYMENDFDKVSDNELIEEVKEYYPHLLEE